MLTFLDEFKNFGKETPDAESFEKFKNVRLKFTLTQDQIDIMINFLLNNNSIYPNETQFRNLYGILNNMKEKCAEISLSHLKLWFGHKRYQLITAIGLDQGLLGGDPQPPNWGNLCPRPQILLTKVLWNLDTTIIGIIEDNLSFFSVKISSLPINEL